MNLIIVIEGTFENHAEEINLPKHTILDEKTIYDHTLNEKYAHNAIFSKPGVISLITRKKLCTLLGEDLATAIQSAKKNHAISSTTSFKDDKPLDLKNLIVLKQIGEGSFGEVYLLADEKGQLVAAKKIHKSKIRKDDYEKYVKRELRILEYIDHPLLMAHRGCFQNDNAMYLFTEFINGTELFHTIRDIGNRPTKPPQYPSYSM